MNVVHLIVHTPEQTREIIAEAVTIADDYDRDTRLWEIVFGKACDLLGARSTLVGQPAPPLVPVPGGVYPRIG